MTTTLLAISVASISAGEVAAQSLYRGTDSGAFQAYHGYYSFESFEHFNTNTGTTVLAFADLVLSGNGGRSLIFQRTYSNHWISSPIDPQDKWRWSFGFPGMVMRVIEQSEQGGAFPMTLEGQIAETPVFIMGDGTRRATVYAITNNENIVLDVEFRKYDRTAKTLYAPDGVVAQYNAQGYLIGFQDAFGNAVTLDRTTIPNAVLVTQSLGTQQRQVRLDLDALGQVTAMTYLHPGGNRTWTYQYTGRDLTRVTPPLGPDWVFGYGSGFLDEIVTPGGGHITYGYNNPNGVPYVRHRTGDHVAPGTWLIGVEFADATLARTTEITTPSGARHRYENYPSTPPTNLALGGGSGFITRTITNAQGQYFEKEERLHSGVGVVQHGSTWLPTTQITWHSLKHREPGQPAAERYHNTTLYYPNGSAQPTSVTRANSGESGLQTFTRTYQNLQSPYIVGLLASESDDVTGIARTWTYNGQTGFLDEARVTAPGGVPAVTTYTPTADGRGNLASVTTPTGKTTAFTYEWGRVKTIQGSEPGSTITFGVNPDGTVASETRAGRLTQYTYDALMRVTGTQGPGGTNPVAVTYDNQTAAFVTTQRGQATTTTWLDEFGAPLETIDGSGVRVRTAYDAEGRVIYQGLPHTPGAASFSADKGTTFTYDLLGRVVTETYADQTQTTRTYGSNTIDILNARGLTTRLTLNGRDQITGVRDAAGTDWTYTYHPTGQLHEIVGPDSVTRRWTYDAEQRLASETHPESGTLLYETYDEAGLLTQTRDAAGSIVTFTYDGNDRVTTVTAGARVTTFTYEPGSDQIAQATVSPTPTAPGVATTFEYDAAGRLETRTDTVDGKAFESRYEYDANDNLTAVVYPSGRRVGYDYDTQNRLTRVYNLDSAANYATAFVYDGAGALAGYTLGNGITTTVSRDADDYRVSAIASGALGLTYTYDQAGNVLSIGDSRPGMDQTFTYDALDRLQSAAGPYGSIPYTFDAHGNQQTSPGGIAWEYHAGNRFRLKNRGGVGNYQYLPNGNLASETAGTYSYTADNLLDSATVNLITTRFAYDAQGWRIRRLVEGGPTYYYTRGPAGRLLSEWMNTSPTTATARDYVYAGAIMLSVAIRTDLPAK